MGDIISDSLSFGTMLLKEVREVCCICGCFRFIPDNNCKVERKLIKMVNVLDAQI